MSIRGLPAAAPFPPAGPREKENALMSKKECIAMLLAGGQGSRMGGLTHKIAKPAVSYGGKYRIIDFSLSNCANSGIDTVGVLTQYKPFLLNSYIGNGGAWDLDEDQGGVHILPPYMDEVGGNWYRGTADSVYQNMDFIEIFEPDYVLIISGDHIYNMNYGSMLHYHKEKKAQVTIAVREVAWEEASRFGITETDANGRILEFSEKPSRPKSNLASMGIYIFDWPCLKQALISDEKDPDSANDFGKNIIPMLLAQGAELYAYRFSGYWRDVGTIESYYKANMELLEPDPPLDLFNGRERIYSNNSVLPPHFAGKDAEISNCLISNGCIVLGTVRNSILGPEVYVEDGAVVEDSVVLPQAVIKRGASLHRVILGQRSLVANDCALGSADDEEEIIVVADHSVISKKTDKVAE